MVESTAIVVAIFVAVIIVVAITFYHRIKAVIKGPGGTGLEMEALPNPLPRPGVRIEDARSRRGGLTAMDATGRGAEIKKVEVERDIQVSNIHSQKPPSPREDPEEISVLYAQSLNAGGNISIAGLLKCCSNEAMEPL